ncbi:hypothetical protein C8J56DRAFT_1041734 [Mycena floridula]|nr:hypothetical protein C8J56DRAFT_1041734 [Mycena floridula]
MLDNSLQNRLTQLATGEYAQLFDVSTDNFEKQWTDILNEIALSDQQGTLNSETALLADTVARDVENICLAMLNFQFAPDSFCNRLLDHSKEVLQPPKPQFSKSPSPPPSSKKPRPSKRPTPPSSSTPTYIKPAYDWFISNLHNPYPCRATRARLAVASGFSRAQIDSWFTAARRRSGWNDLLHTHFSTRKSMLDAALRFKASSSPRNPFANADPNEKLLDSALHLEFTKVETRAMEMYTVDQSPLMGTLETAVELASDDLLDAAKDELNAEKNAIEEERKKEVAARREEMERRKNEEAERKKKEEVLRKRREAERRKREKHAASLRETLASIDIVHQHKRQAAIREAEKRRALSDDEYDATMEAEKKRRYEDDEYDAPVKRQRTDSDALPSLKRRLADSDCSDDESQPSKRVKYRVISGPRRIASAQRSVSPEYPASPALSISSSRSSSPSLPPTPTDGRPIALPRAPVRLPAGMKPNGLAPQRGPIILSGTLFDPEFYASWYEEGNFEGPSSFETYKERKAAAASNESTVKVSATDATETKKRTSKLEPMTPLDLGSLSSLDFSDYYAGLVGSSLFETDVVEFGDATEATERTASEDAERTESEGAGRTESEATERTESYGTSLPPLGI